MEIKKPNALCIILILMSLDSIRFDTFFGVLPLSLIGCVFFLFSINLKSQRININSKYGNTLLLFGLFFTLTSLFIGSSIVGNLIVIWISIFIAYFIPSLEISSYQWAYAIKKTILFHSLFMLFDVFFETPWYWDRSIFFLGFGMPDFYRPSGLFGEPSFYALSLNCLLLILTILRKCSKKDCLLVSSTIILSTSISGILTTLVIIITNYISEIISFIRNFIFKGLLNRKIFFVIPLVVILLLPLFIFNEGWVLTRLFNPLFDTSLMGRTLGLLPTIEYVYQNSPLIGIGLGSEVLNNIEYNLFEFVRGLETVPVTPTYANAIIAIFVKGGFVGLILYLLYIFQGLQLRYLLPFLLILATSGKAFYILIFIIPAINKYIVNRKNLILNNKI